jgi:hypothetical protein
MKFFLSLVIIITGVHFLFRLVYVNKNQVIIIIKLNDFIKQSPSWEADCSSSSKEIFSYFIEPESYNDV